MPQRSRVARKSAGTRPFAEIRVRDKNLKMQLQLIGECSKFDRDWGTWNRDNEKRERNVLVDLAHMMDAKLTPSVDDWFGKRRIRQASSLPDPPLRRPLRGSTDARSDDDDDGDDVDSALRLIDRQRMLEAKRSDWLGVTSVPPSIRPRPMSAAVLAATAAVAAASAAAITAAAAAVTGFAPPSEAADDTDGGLTGAVPAAEVKSVPAGSSSQAPPSALLPLRPKTSIGGSSCGGGGVKLARK